MSKIERTLHREQYAMLNSIVKGILQSTTADAGIAIAPPAFGKTSVITAAIDYVANCFYSQSKTMARRTTNGVCLMLTPRLMLNEQQTIEIQSLNINSDKFPNHPKKVITFDSDNSLDVNNVIRFIEQCHASNFYPIVVSTYDSADKLASIPFDAIFCDEGHNVCSPQNFMAVMDVLSAEAKRVFITATPRIDYLGQGPIGVNQRGMRNVQRFGKVVYSLSFKQAVKLGFIVPPRKVFMHTFGKGMKKDSHVLDIIVRTMNEMKLAMEDTPIPNKVIYVFESVAEIQILEANWELIKKLTGANIYTAYSADNSFKINGEKLSGSGNKIKKEFIHKLKTDKEDCILAHIDTMGEGVDVPGITGAIIFPIGDVIRIIQNLGRAMRLLPEDRNKTPKDRIKKFANIGIVSYNDENSGSNFMNALIEAIMRMESDEFISEFLQCDLTNNPAGMEPVDVVGTPKNSHTDNQSDLLAFTANIEDANFELFASSFDVGSNWDNLFEMKTQRETQFQLERDERLRQERELQIRTDKLARLRAKR